MVVRRDGDGRGLAFGSLETVGQGGALIRCHEPIPESAEADLAICLAGGVIRARARVLYHLPGEDGLGIGVEFLELRGGSQELLDHLVLAPEDEEEPP